MRNKLKVYAATVVLIVLALVLLYGNHNTAGQVGLIAQQTGRSFDAVGELHHAEYGVVRIVSSVNELMVLSASRSQTNPTPDEAEADEEGLIADGKDVFRGSMERVRKNLEMANVFNTEIETALHGIEQQYLSFLQVVEKIVLVSNAPFDPENIRELKEQFELEEQQLLAKVRRAIGIAESINEALIQREQSHVEWMEWQTVLMWVVLVAALLVYAYMVLGAFKGEADARRTIETTVQELEEAVQSKEREMELRLSLEQELAHHRKIETLGVLAGGMAHELNNQLQPAMSMAELLLDVSGPEEQNRRKLELILSGIKHAKTTVAKILSFARQKQGQRNSCDVSEVMVNLKDIMAMSCPSSIRLDVSYADQIGEVGLSDTNLESVILNLFTNAVHAIGDDQGEISVTAEREVAGAKEAGCHARITVRDTGCGIPEELHERVLDPFFTTKEVGQGTGLGMWQVSNLLAGVQGTIDLDSDVGMGTTMTLHIPVMIEENHDAAIQN